MSLRLMTLPNGHLSLEFEMCDLPTVEGVIVELFGGRKISQHNFVSECWEFGGEEFIHSSEWDDPCLIARSAEGNQVLCVLCERLQEKSEN